MVCVRPCFFTPNKRSITTMKNSQSSSVIGTTTSTKCF